jgi:transcriptional regulator with XRE-family HTH domain
MRPMQPRKPLGEKVKEFRARRGWTTAQMAAAVGKDVKRQHIEQLEAAGDRMPRYLVALADAMGASLDDLLDRSPLKYARAPAERQISMAQDLAGDPPDAPRDDGATESRLRALEDAVLKINTLLPTLATKDDLHREINAQTWRFVTWTTGIGGLLVTATYFIARHVSP